MKTFIVLAILAIAPGCLSSGKQFKITDTETGVSVTISEDDLKVEIGKTVTLGGITIEAEDKQ